MKCTKPLFEWPTAYGQSLEERDAALTNQTFMPAGKISLQSCGTTVPSEAPSIYSRESKEAFRATSRRDGRLVGKLPDLIQRLKAFVKKSATVMM